MMGRFLVALDLSSEANGLVRCSGQLSALTEGEAVLVHALGTSRPRDFSSTQIAYQALVKRIEEEGGRVSETLITRVSEGDDLILKSAQELQVGLILMGWGPDCRLGSVARGVVLGANCSILLVGAEFDGSLSLIDGAGGVERVCVRDLAPLARLGAVRTGLASLPRHGALLVEFEDTAMPGAA